MKSNTQKEKERGAVVSFFEYVYNDGMSIGDASLKAGYTGSNMRLLRRKYFPNSFESELREKGFNPSDWNHGWLKSEEVSVHIKNQENQISYEEIRDEQIKEMNKYAPKYKIVKREKSKDGHLLVVDVADIHMGKLATLSDTTQEYNMDIAQKAVEDGISGLLTKASGFTIDKILLIIGNDVLHVDTPHNNTTAGTHQDQDGMWHQAFIRARKLYVHLVETLLPISDIECVFNPSNHDYMSGFMLADSLASWFHNNKQIKFNVDLRHRKYFIYGKSLIGTTHGDGVPDTKLAKIMPTEAREMWSKAEFCYWYAHHLHHKIAKDDIGVCIEYLRSPTTADRWHSDNGLITQPAMEAFIHSKDRGQIARLTHYV